MIQTTMEEFIAKHKLNVNIQDSAATKLIAKRLVALGYRAKKVRLDGTTKRVWVKRGTELQELQERLDAIKE